MTFYEQQIGKIREQCYSNVGQIATVIQVRRFIDDNFDRELTLDDLTSVRLTSKFYLLRLFRRYYGQTPRQYLIEKRIEKAKELLRNGRSVTEACFAVGYETPSSFATLFRRRSGVTPSEFRRRAIFAKLG
ncbi:MAG: helix-turn-helix transcriptional regulator [Acidobacteria bacterium]|nr:helix-turn-helix transcriptional regulator [Acidobacteriota bacterium]